MTPRGGTPPAPRDVRVELTRKEAELMRHRCEREQNWLRARAAQEGRPLTEDERSNDRRYRRIIAQIVAALIEAGHE